MIRKLRTQRDNQQWMHDLAVNLRGRVQNFERDDPEVPPGKRARSYRMYSKVWREYGEHQEGLARRAEAIGFKATATEHYDLAIDAYRRAQHTIYYDDNPIKIHLYEKMCEMVDRRSACASYPIERVEVPFEDGKTISCLFHLLPDHQKAPCIVYVPGMDETKDVFPKAAHNVAADRGFHVIAMDGPGQGSSNIQKIRAVGDKYEKAGAAVIDYVLSREEVEPSKVAVFGISMGSYWSLKVATYDHRIAALASAVACFNPNNTIFTQSSPRFKQMFMYMAGMDNEDEFDEMASEMTVRGQLHKVRCPTLLMTGEFDPLCPLEDAIEAFEELQVPKEMWVLENQFHQLRGLPNLGSVNHYQYILDWLSLAFAKDGLPDSHCRIAYVREKGDGPFGDCEWSPTVGPGQAYF